MATEELDRTLKKMDAYDFDSPSRRRYLRFQYEAMTHIRDHIVMQLPDDDRERWVAALEPLTQRIISELAIQEGNGNIGCLLTVFESEWEEVR